MIWNGTDMNHLIVSVTKKKDGVVLESKIVNLYCKNDEAYYKAISDFEADGYTDMDVKHDVPLSDEEEDEYLSGVVF